MFDDGLAAVAGLSLQQEAKAAFGVLTGLFLNAGIFAVSPIEAVDEATWNRLFEVNAKGQFFTLQKALPLLADSASVVVTVGIGATRAIVLESGTADSGRERPNDVSVFSAERSAATSHVSTHRER